MKCRSQLLPMFIIAKNKLQKRDAFIYFICKLCTANKIMYKNIEILYY